MTAVLKLVFGQFNVALLSVTIFLLVARQLGQNFYYHVVPMVMMLTLLAFAIVTSVWGVFVRSWWAYTIASSVLATILIYVTFTLVEVLVAGTLAKLGPMTMVFFILMIAFISSYMFGGIGRLLIGVVKR